MPVASQPQASTTRVVDVHIEEQGPPASTTDAERLERLIGAALPPAYREFVLANNGGYPVPDTFRFADGRPGSAVHQFFALRGKQASNRLSYAVEVFAERVPPGLLPIARDPFGNLICLGVLGSDYSGEVWFWDHEREADEGEPARTDNLTKIADSFSDFLDGLHPAGNA